MLATFLYVYLSVGFLIRLHDIVGMVLLGRVKNLLEFGAFPQNCGLFTLHSKFCSHRQGQMLEISHQYWCHIIVLVELCWNVKIMVKRTLAFFP